MQDELLANDKSELYTIAKLADALQMNRLTLYRWINWYNSDLNKPANMYLPEYFKDPMDRRNKYYLPYYEIEEDGKKTTKHVVEIFKDFRESLRGQNYGAMNKYNNYWFRKSKNVSDEEAVAIKNSRIKQEKNIKLI